MGNELISQNFRLDLEDGLFIRGEVKVINDGAAKAVILLSHGGRGHKDWGFWPYVSTWFAERGFYTVNFDFSRIGIKEAEVETAIKNAANTFSRELLDLDSLLSHIKESKLPFAEQAIANQVIILGHSRAGATNIIFASEHPEISSVIIWNGGANLNPPKGVVFDDYVLEDLNVNKERFNIPQKLALITFPALIVQGDQDSEPLLKGNQIFREAAPDQSFVSIPGADHTFGVIHPFAGTTTFLEETLELTMGFLLNNKVEFQLIKK
jgi:uncharacterized protein